MQKEWTDEYNPFNSWKSLAHAECMRAIIDEDFLAPVTVNLDLMDGCNYRCPRCIWGKAKGKGKMSPVPTEKVMKVPRFLKKWGVKGVFLAGGVGDPSLHPDLHKILKEIHHQSLDAGLVTNGYMLKGRKMRAAAHYCKFVGFSVDAGTPEAYAKVHGVSDEHFGVVVENTRELSRYKEENGLDVQIAYKFLIFPESCHTIYEAAQIARDAGVNHLQIRPAELPVEETRRIDVDSVNEQIEKARGLETKVFQVFGVRHKFNPDLTKKTRERCYATPLTSTWLANGDVILCADSRDMDDNVLCNYLEEGLPAVREAWGGKKHRDLIAHLNSRLDKCKRCAYSGYNEIIERVIADDGMDRNMI